MYGPMKMQLTIANKVGGLLGLGGTMSTTLITFDKNWYFAGEECTVNLVCDNSHCSTGVKSFKLKFKRKVMARGQWDNVSQMVKTSNYLYQFKDKSLKCGPHTKMQRSLTFTIPTEDPESFGEFPLAASHKGALFEIAYSLKIFVKHDAVT